MSESNDIFKLSSIFDQIRSEDMIQFLSQSFTRNYLLELLQIILLHSLENNQLLSRERKDSIEVDYSDIYRSLMKEHDIIVSFYSTMIILEKIYNISVPAFYLFMNGLISQQDVNDQFKDNLFQSLISNNIILDEDERDYLDYVPLFSNRFRQFYHILKALILNNPNITQEERRENELIQQEYHKYSFNNIRNIHDDYNKILAVRDMMLETDPETKDNILNNIIANGNYYRNNLSFLFRIESFRWSEILDWMTMDDIMYDREDLILNYFVTGIISNPLICIRLLDEFGAEFCNLKYIDNYGNTPLMYACGLHIDVSTRNNGTNVNIESNEPTFEQDQFYNNEDFMSSTNNDDDLTEYGEQPPPAPRLNTRSLNPPEMDEDELPDEFPSLRRYGGKQKGGEYDNELELAIKIFSYGTNLSNLEFRNSLNLTAYNYAVKTRMEFLVFVIDKFHYPNTNMYNDMMNITINRDEIINDYISMDEIEVNNLTQYLNENNDVFVLKYNNTYCIAFIDEIIKNAIDGKRYPCNQTSDTTYRPTDNMIIRNKPIFDVKKISGLSIDGVVLYNDITNFDLSRSRYYVLIDTGETYPSFVSSVLVDSAVTENVVSMTHCNPGAGGKIYTLKAANLNITQAGQGRRKVKYLRKKRSSKRASKKSSKRASKKSSKIRYKRN
jgi:hypothetical protein